MRGRELLLLAAIRAEAHRFALKHHRRARRAEGLASLLESFSGVGPGRRKMLLEAFGSVDAMAQAGVDGLRQAGLPRNLAQRMNAWLMENVLDSDASEGPEGLDAPGGLDAVDDVEMKEE